MTLPRPDGILAVVRNSGIIARGLWPALTAALVACSGVTGPPPAPPGDGPGPAAEIAAFSADWAAGHTHDASAYADDPGAAALIMTAVVADLGAESLRIDTGPVQRVADREAKVTATLTWQLPDIGPWSYDAVWRWHRTGGDWLLDFDPTVIHPELGPGQTMSLRRDAAIDGPIVDRHDVLLMAPVRVYSVVLLLDGDTDGAARELAALLHDTDPEVTARGITDGVMAARAAGEASYTVTNLRESDFTPVEAALTAVAGVTLPSEVRDLPPTPGFAETILSPAVAVATRMAAGTPGWRVVTVDRVGDELTTLVDHPAQPGPKVTLTLDPAVQDAAQSAVDTVTKPAVIVAIEPVTGEILAVAQNASATAQGPLATMGNYPPGSTFKIVTATAAIDAGLITPRSMVDCPGTWSRDGKSISNEGFALGRVSTTTAFAKSCNTTFASLAAQMPPDALPEAAAQYGIGLDFDIQGVTTLTGAIQPGDTALARAQNGFGQGTDLVTPFSAALMAATVAGGADMPVPVLIRGTETSVDRTVPTRSDKAATALPTLMRAVVTDGTARLLDQDGAVSAKTGTAEYVNSKGTLSAHAWTVGYRGKIAFSALIVGGGSSKNSNEIAHTFLSGLPDR